MIELEGFYHAEAGDQLENITYHGESKPLKEWAKELDIPYQTLYSRFMRGKSGEELFKPVANSTIPTPRIVVIHNNLAYTLRLWAQTLGIKPSVLYRRYKAGERGDALFRPVGAMNPEIAERRANTQSTIEALRAEIEAIEALRAEIEALKAETQRLTNHDQANQNHTGTTT